MFMQPRARMRSLAMVALVTLVCVPSIAFAQSPNILFIFSDDHAVDAISANGGRLAGVAPTPNIDRLAKEGVLFRNSFCANSICGPSRATILTGKHSHKNGFMSNVSGPFDQTQWTVAKALQASGYQTAVIGKWHLHSDPVGFDHWEILPGQGHYYNPVFIQQDGRERREEGYVTDLVTDKALRWLQSRDQTQPFFLMCQHKAPHRTFAPALRHLDAFKDVTIPEPATLFDDYSGRAPELAQNEMEIDRHFDWAYDVKLRHDERGEVKLPPPDRYGTPEYNRMTPEQKRSWDAHYGPLNQQFLKRYASGNMTSQDVVRWKYQRYMQNYLATVKAVDENVGRLLDYLDETGLAANTLVIYSSDQGFYLGEHGWYDKRWMFEQSLRMPLLARWPGVIPAGSQPTELVQNIDYAPTFLDVANQEIPTEVQGRSLLPLMRGESPDQWRDAIYYAYYEVGEHAVPRHFGVRTDRFKLIYFPDSDRWNLFDLQRDPDELHSVYEMPEYAEIRTQLTTRFYELRDEYEAPPFQ